MCKSILVFTALNSSFEVLNEERGGGKLKRYAYFLAQCCTKILHFLDRNFLTKNNGLKNERNRRNLSSEKELEVLHAGSEGGARHKMQNCSLLATTAVALEWAGLKDCTQIAFRDISFGLVSY